MPTSSASRPSRWRAAYNRLIRAYEKESEDSEDLYAKTLQFQSGMGRGISSLVATHRVVILRRYSSEWAFDQGKADFDYASAMREVTAQSSTGLLFGDDLAAASAWLIAEMNTPNRSVFLTGAYSEPKQGCASAIGKAIERAGCPRLKCPTVPPPSRAPWPTNGHPKPHPRQGSAVGHADPRLPNLFAQRLLRRSCPLRVCPVIPRIRWLLLLIVSALVGCSSPQAWGPGVVAPDTPIQTGSDRPDWTVGQYQFHALAEFTIRARVLSETRYHTGRESALSPEDLALGWGNMSDEAVLSKLKISQGDRWYFYKWGPPGPPIPVHEIIESSANMHMIPANDDIAILLKNVEVGQVVTLQGALVSIRAADGWHWRSSTSRTDSGNGSCEVVWVENVTVQDAPDK